MAISFLPDPDSGSCVPINAAPFLSEQVVCHLKVQPFGERLYFPVQDAGRAA